MLALSYLVGLATGAQGWWGAALVVLIVVAVPIGFALRRKTPDDSRES